MGQGFRRGPAHLEARKLLLALPRQADRLAKSLRGTRRQRHEVARRGRHGRDVFALHLQPQSARFVDRHAAAQLHPPPARRPHASELGHCRGRLRQKPGNLAGNFRRRSRPRSVDAPGIRTRPRHAKGLRGQPQGHRLCHGPARPDQLGPNRQRMLRALARTDRPRGRGHRGTHRKKRRGGQSFRRTSARGPARGKKTRRLGRPAALVARPSEQKPALHRDGAGRREDHALRQLEGRPASGRTRHKLPRPFPAHQNQAALHCGSAFARRVRVRHRGGTEKGTRRRP